MVRTVTGKALGVTYSWRETSDMVSATTDKGEESFVCGKEKADTWVYLTSITFPNPNFTLILSLA